MRSENLDGELVPIDQVLSDMYNDYSAVQSCARSYYYTYYATDEERKQMDLEDKINSILSFIFFFIFFLIVISSAILAFSV